MVLLLFCRVVAWPAVVNLCFPLFSHAAVFPTVSFPLLASVIVFSFSISVVASAGLCRRTALIVGGGDGVGKLVDIAKNVRARRGLHAYSLRRMRVRGLHAQSLRRMRVRGLHAYSSRRMKVIGTSVLSLRSFNGSGTPHIATDVIETDYVALARNSRW